LIPNEKITLKDQRRGQNYYMTFSIFNALSFICLADSLLILFALKMGCPDYLVAVFGAFMYLGNIAMFLGKYMMGRIGAARTITLFWIFRNIFGLILASAPFFATHISPLAGMAVLISSSLLFYLCRSAGALAMQPLLGEITIPGNRGKYVSDVFIMYNLMAVVGYGILIYFFKEGHTISLFQKIIITGACIGGASIFFVFPIKESTIPMLSAQQPIKNEILKILKNPTYKKLLMANALAFSGIVLVVPISMLALKEGYLIPNYKAMSFSLIQFSGGILIAFLSRLLADETGPRPLIILYFCLLSVISIFWIAAPDTFYWFYTFIIFLLCGCCFMGIPLVLMNYFLATVKAIDRVGISFFISICSGVCAGLTGCLVGSVTLKILSYFEFDTPLHLYKMYFAVILLLLVPAIYFIAKLEKQEDWAVKDVLGLLIAPRDIRALFMINSINKIEAPLKENENIDKLESIPSGLSGKKLLAYLDSPKFYVRGKAISALRQMPLIDKAKQALIRELDRGEFTTAFYAAQMLGEQNVKEAIPALIEKLNSKDNYLKSKAMYSLAQLGEKSAYSKIEKIFERTSNPRVIIHGALALGKIGDPEALKLLLKKAVSDIPYQVLHEIILAIAEISEIPDSFYKFLKHFMIDQQVSKSDLMEYMDTLNSTQMTDELKQQLESFNEGNTNAGPIINLILDHTKHKKRTIIRIIDNFLTKCNPEKVPAELLYCIICVFRKNGSL
jgi:MFS family permease